MIQNYSSIIIQMLFPQIIVLFDLLAFLYRDALPLGLRLMAIFPNTHTYWAIYPDLLLINITVFILVLKIFL